MYKGEKVSLSAVEREDLCLLMNWRNNPQFRKYFREYREINMDMQNRWYENKVLNDPGTIMFSIRSNEDHSLLGCCGLCYINWVYRNADLSLYIGKDGAYIDGLGYAEESCRILFDYGFKELGLEKIWTEIYEFDDKKLGLYQKLGMRVDGVLRHQYFYDGEWRNSKMLSILQEEWTVREDGHE